MKIFISYRTSDTIQFVGRIHDKLASTPGVTGVFRDKNRIDPGASIRTEIIDALDESDVYLIVIGNDWVGAGIDDSTTEIEKEDDWVRFETAQALELAAKENGKKRKVIPVLVETEKIPSNDMLPDDLHNIQGKKWVHIRDNSFDQDLAILINAVFGYKPPTYLREFFLQRPWLEAGLKAAVGFVFGLVTYFTVPGLLGFESVVDLLPGGNQPERIIDAWIALILWIIFWSWIAVLWGSIAVNFWSKR